MEVQTEYFHVFNRGVEKRNIFMEEEDLLRFLESMESFNVEEPIGSLFELKFLPRRQVVERSLPLVDVVCYCLNPNHFHILLRQRCENGISRFIQRLSAGYTRYFNIKNRRSGVLFQGKYKSVPIVSNEQLLRVSAYVNLNNRVHRLGTRSTKSSWNEFIGQTQRKICVQEHILDQFSDRDEYRNFAEEALVDMLKRKDSLKELRQLFLE